MANGSWTDHGPLPIPQNADWNEIDPNLLIDPSGSLHLSYGSYWDDIYQVPFTDPLTVGDTSAPAHLAYNSTNDAVEGSFQFWWTLSGTTYYYLFFSSGACCNAADSLAPPGEEYKVMVCRSSSPSGPFVDSSGADCATANGGTPVLESHGANVYAPGGQGVWQTTDGDLVLYYHYGELFTSKACCCSYFPPSSYFGSLTSWIVDPTVGYDIGDFKFGWNYMAFNDDGWPYLTTQ